MPVDRRFPPTLLAATMAPLLNPSGSEIINTIVAQAGSILELARQPPERWIEQGLRIGQARELHERALSAAIWIARQYRERELRGADRQTYDVRRGFAALTDGPRYDMEFDEDWSNMARPNAIEARTSPVAYLVSLYKKALSLEGAADEGNRFRLEVRRPDIAAELIDSATMTRECSVLSLSTKILESSLLEAGQLSDPDAIEADRVLASARYPLTMPYEHSVEQLQIILSLFNPPVSGFGELARATDPDFHYFALQGMQTDRGDDTFLLSLPIGPARRELLLEALFNGARPDNEEQMANFYWTTYRVYSRGALEDSAEFCTRTGVSSDALAGLFAVKEDSPVLSRHVSQAVMPQQESGPHVFGAVYINGAQLPAIDLKASPGSDTFQRDTEAVPVNPPVQFENLADGHLDRIHRLIRLSRWLGTSFREMDQLIVAAHHAEKRNGAPLITRNTLKALGVFCEMRGRYGVTAEDFCAWLDKVSIFGAGETVAQYDRIFVNHGLLGTPLVLDNSPFSARIEDNTDDHSRETVQAICASLGLDSSEFTYMARVVANSYDPPELKRSLEILSSFYRIASIARYLSVPPTVLLGLVQTLGQSAPILKQIAGVPSVEALPTLGATDFSAALMAVVDCVQWCGDKGIDLAWFVRAMRSNTTVPVASDSERALVASLHTMLGSLRVTHEVLEQAGVPAVLTLATIDWVAALGDVIDAQGIVLDGVSSSDVDYALSVRNIIADVVERIAQAEDPFPMDDPIEADTLKNTIVESVTAIILRMRASQRALVEEHLATYLAISSDLVLPLIEWADQSVYDVLRWVWEAEGVVTPAGSLRALALRRLSPCDPVARRLRAAVQPHDAFQDDGFEDWNNADVMLQKLGSLHRLADIVRQFELDGEFLSRHAANKRQLEGWIDAPDLFGFRPGMDATGAISLATLYHLQTYRNVTSRMQASPSALMDYLSLVNDPLVFDPDLFAESEDYARLMQDAAAVKVAEMLGVSARELLEAARFIAPMGVLTQLSQFNGLIRMLEMARTSELSILALHELGGLPVSANTEDYRNAVQYALGSLYAGRLQSGGSGNAPEVGQGTTSESSVDQTRLVANALDLAPAKAQARFRLLVRDLSGKPLVNIRVRWSLTGPGALDTDMAHTDADGRVEVTLASSAKMGIATVFATIGLDQRIAMPTVTIDCDDETLNLRRPKPDAEGAPKLSGRRESFELSVTVLDGYDNRGRNRRVRWNIVEGAGQFKRDTTIADDNGVARAQLSSNEEGITTVKATLGAGVSLGGFAAFRFIDAPYIDRSVYRLRFRGPNVLGQVVKIACRVLSLSGAGKPQEQIGWRVTFADESVYEGPTTSDPDGYALFEVPASELKQGTITVRATLLPSRKDDDREDFFEQVMVILPVPRLAAASPANVSVIALAGEVVHVRVRVEAEVETDIETVFQGVAEHPVQWTVDGARNAKETLTDSEGTAVFAVPIDQPGEHTVVATLNEPAGQVVTFTVNVLAEPNWRFSLTSLAQQASEEPRDSLTFVVGRRYTLTLEDTSDASDRAGREIALTWSGVNPVGQGLVANPSFLQMRQLPGDGRLSWEIECRQLPDPRAVFSIGATLQGTRYSQILRTTIKLDEALSRRRRR
ncbi:Tc toxin subunit A [Pseudomonas sp. SWRI154]|uniref:Tc toxin subunit A n=1 Tax=Pseudomonas sp. SWRI154 TaxID=2745501 RepID=UPI0016493621|nr:Tc toxin subunit A [Pseudomonas sp. SWRI154]MBC3364517.1 Ig-like domain-containing protein [Pseudomonas sp. SWRI154]